MFYRLGIDLGTTYTAAAVLVEDHPEMLALGNRALQVPTVLYADPDGTLSVGEVAEQRGTVEPDRLVREFKRRVGDTVPIIVSGVPYSPQALVGTVLRWVVAVASQRQGEPPAEITVTHPASWGPFKVDLLRQSIRLADLHEAELLTEPEAAAVTYARRHGISDGETVAVYDLGGGTFDAAVLRREGSRFRLLGDPEGIEHLGGVDFDDAVFHHVWSSLRDRPDSLDQNDPTVTLALARLRRDCVIAKEALSSDTEVTVAVVLPGLSTSVRLTRQEFDEMLRAPLGATVAATRRVLRSAEVSPDQLRAIVLIGGSSRIPRVSEVLAAEFGRPLALDAHPKHDVALGAALGGHAVALGPSRVRAATSNEPVTVPTTDSPQPALVHLAPAPTSVRTSTRAAVAGVLRKPRASLAIAVGLIALIAGSTVVIGLLNGTDPPGGATGSPTTRAEPTPTGSAPATQPTSAVPLDDTHIVWTRTRSSDGKFAIFTVPSDGTADERRLTSWQTGKPQANISPDRSQVVYVASTGSLRSVTTVNGKTQDRPFFPDDVEVDADCASLKRPAWSGNRYFVAPCGTCPETLPRCGVGQPTAVYRLDFDGRATKLVEDAGRPTVSPDGRYVAYERHGALFLGDLDGTAPARQLTSPGKTSPDSEPAWSPDGRLAFRRQLPGGSAIFTMQVLSGSVVVPETDRDETRIYAGKADVHTPSWSPTGQQIVFRVGPSATADLWVMDSDGTSRHRLLPDSSTDALAADVFPTWRTW